MVKCGVNCVIILGLTLLWGNCQARQSFYFFFSFLIKSCLCLFFFLVFCLCAIWFVFRGSAQASMAWLNLLSVRPLGRTLYRFQDWPKKRTEPIL